MVQGPPYTQGEDTWQPLHAVTARHPGWGGINLRDNERFIQPWEAHDTLNWTNRTGLQSDNIGVLATRYGYADGPKYGVVGGSSDTAGTDYPVRFLAKFYPTVGPDEAGTGGQVLRLVQTAAGANKTDFQKWTGSAWTTWNTATSAFAIGGSTALKNGSTGHPSGGYYPQWIVLDLPTPLFCWIDPENGLYTYDGTTLTKQEIPKYSDSGATNITGALWLDQDNGRLIVAGNITDAGEHRVIYYSAAGDTTKWLDVDGGGQVVAYGSDSRALMANPKWMRGIATLGGSLVVFSDDSRHVIGGIGFANQQQEVFAHQGCWSGKCLVKWNDALYWWGKDGAYRWSGGIADRISDKIWNKVADLKMVSAYKWFSFVFMDQWWTCVRYKNDTPSGYGTAHGYYNFVYDFKTDEWYIFDIPMVAAFSSLGGLTDIGRLYFASPTARSAKYYTYTYGFDEVDQHITFADACYGSAGSRTGTAITSGWETGKLNGGNISAQLPDMAHVSKYWYKVATEIATTECANFPVVGGSQGSFTAAKMEYRTDRTAAYSDLASFTTDALTNVFQHMYPGDVYGHYIQYKFTVTGTKQLIIYRMYNVWRDLGMSMTEG